MKPDIDISQLSPAECILLAEELWDRVRIHPDAVPVRPDHLAEIQRRVDALDSGAMAPGESWEVVSARLWGRRQPGVWHQREQ